MGEKTLKKNPSSSRSFAEVKFLVQGFDLWRNSLANRVLPCAPVGPKFPPKTRLFEAKVGMMDKMGEKHLKTIHPQVGVLQRSSFLFKGLTSGELP